MRAEADASALFYLSQLEAIGRIGEIGMIGGMGEIEKSN